MLGWIIFAGVVLLAFLLWCSCRVAAAADEAQRIAWLARHGKDW